MYSASNTWKIAILGGGRMGLSICDFFLRAGVPCMLKTRRTIDLSSQLKTFEKAIKKGKFEKRNITRPVQFVRSYEEINVSKPDLVIECIEEDYDLKIKELSLFCETVENVLVASNTSSFSIKMLADKTSLQERMLGLHFLYPVSILRTAEMIIPAMPNNQIDSVKKLLADAGLDLVEVKDSPGFFINRVLIAGFLHACYLREKYDLTTRDIDKAFVRLGAYAGPFEMADQVGLDVLAAIMRSMQDAKMEITVPDVFAKLYSSGKYGAKTGQGFYVYPRVNTNNDGVEVKAVLEIAMVMEKEAEACIEDNIVNCNEIEKPLTAVLGLLGSKIGLNVKVKTTGENIQ